MPQTRISTNLQLLQQHFEQHVNPRGQQASYFKYTFAVREGDPTSGDARQEYAGGTGRGSMSRFFPLSLLDVDEARFQRFVAGTARGLVENLPRYSSDLVGVDFGLLEDPSLVEEADFQARVARSQREATYESSVSTLEIACDYLEIPLPEDRPDYLGLLQAIHLYGIFDKDFEALLDELTARLRALPEEARTEASRWMAITARFVRTNPVKVLWRGQQLPLEEPVVQVLGALHQELHGTDLPVIQRPGDEEVVEESEAPPQPVLQWSSEPLPVIRVPMSDTFTWTRRFQNLGGAATELTLKVRGPVVDRELFELHSRLEGVEHPMTLTHLVGFSQTLSVDLEAGSEQLLELVFRGRSAGGGFATVEMQASVSVEPGQDGTTVVSVPIRETLQVFVG